MINASVRMKAALVIYLVTAAIDFILGIRYFFSNEFMSYHSQAIDAPWQEVELGTQTLILALMKMAGTGWIVLGFFTIMLVLAALRTGSLVARWTLPLGTVIFYSGSFAATWGVYQQTGAPTPWGQSIAMVGIAMFALVIDEPWIFRIRGKGLV